MHLEVDPPALRAAAARLRDTAADVGTLREGTSGPAGLRGAAGPRVAAAAADFDLRWSAGLAVLAATATALADLLSAAAESYARTDAGLMPRG